jgi:hypothetical protein
MTNQETRAVAALARALAPHIVDEVLAELDRRGLVVTASNAQTRLLDEYDAATCEEYVRELGTPVLPRASKFFQYMAAHGEISAPELVELLGLKTARQIPANLTNSLKQRARRLGLDRPWAEGATPDGRTVWRNRDGLATRMVEALMDEETRRLGHPADDIGGPRDVASRARLAKDRSEARS